MTSQCNSPLSNLYVEWNFAIITKRDCQVLVHASTKMINDDSEWSITPERSIPFSMNKSTLVKIKHLYYEKVRVSLEISVSKKDDIKAASISSEGATGSVDAVTVLKATPISSEIATVYAFCVLSDKEGLQEYSKADFEKAVKDRQMESPNGRYLIDLTESEEPFLDISFHKISDVNERAKKKVSLYLSRWSLNVNSAPSMFEAGHSLSSPPLSPTNSPTTPQSPLELLDETEQPSAEHKENKTNGSV